MSAFLLYGAPTPCQVTRVTTLMALTTFRERHTLHLPPLASPAPSLWVRSMLVQSMPDPRAMLRTAWTEGYHYLDAASIYNIYDSHVRSTTTSHRASRHNGLAQRLRVHDPDQSPSSDATSDRHLRSILVLRDGEYPLQAIRDAPTEVPTSDAHLSCHSARPKVRWNTECAAFWGLPLPIRSVRDPQERPVTVSAANDHKHDRAR